MLIEQQLFPAMYKHLESLDVKISLVLIPWFMTSFTYQVRINIKFISIITTKLICCILQLPLAVAFRVMDALLLEGIPALFRIALSILLVLLFSHFIIVIIN